MLKFVILLLFSFINYSFCCTGCLDLDELTFDKTIKKFKTALVKFDQSFPYGEHHEVFAAFSQQISNKTFSESGHPDVMLGTVGVKDYGDMENKKLADKYEIKAESFPAIKLFVDGNLETPIDFEIGTEKLSIARLFTFLKENSNAYVEAPGCVEELDKLALKFMKNKNDRSKIIKATEHAIEQIKCVEKKNIAKFYSILMKGTAEKGEDFIAKQRERMNKLLKDKLSSKKIEEINKKLNILSSFKIMTAEKEEL